MLTNQSLAEGTTCEYTDARLCGKIVGVALYCSTYYEKTNAYADPVYDALLWKSLLAHASDPWNDVVEKRVANRNGNVPLKMKLPPQDTSTVEKKM